MYSFFYDVGKYGRNNFAVVLDDEESQDVYEYLPEEEQN